LRKNFVFGVGFDTGGGDMIRERFAALLAERGWTLEEFSKRSGLSINTVKNISGGKTIDPQLSTAAIIAETFGISINCLMGKCPHTPQEKELLRLYRETGKHGKSIITLIARYEAGAIKSEREAKDKHPVPCLLPQGDITNGIIYDACKEEEEITSIPEAYSAIKMPNDDLAPMFCEGDIILFEDRIPKSGEYAGILNGDRAFIRKFIKENGQYKFECLHNHGKDIFVKRLDEINFIGTICGVIRN
jgi:transcriptional regulator with XRE-family HTH domain